jgi:hypothetical protein
VDLGTADATADEMDETADIETEMEDMAAGHAMTIRGREGTKAMGTKKTPESYGGTRAARHHAVCLVVGLLSLQSSVFPPFITWGKRFLDAFSGKVKLPSIAFTCPVSGPCPALTPFFGINTYCQISLW